jgi:hypothetical protein
MPERSNPHIHRHGGLPFEIERNMNDLSKKVNVQPLFEAQLLSNIPTAFSILHYLLA